MKFDPTDLRYNIYPGVFTRAVSVGMDVAGLALRICQFLPILGQIVLRLLEI